MPINSAEQPRLFTNIIKKIFFIKKPAYKPFVVPRNRLTRKRFFETYNTYRPFDFLKQSAFTAALTTSGFFDAQKKELIKIIAAVLQRFQQF